MGMDFEQALKVHQGIWAWQGIAIVQGHFFPVYGKALHGVDGSAHVKDKGLPWLRADAQGRIQHNSTLALVHPAIGFGSLCKVDTPAYTAGSGKGANEGRVVDEAVIQGMEQMPIPGCIMGVACMPRAIVGKPSGQ